MYLFSDLLDSLMKETFSVYKRSTTLISSISANLINISTLGWVILAPI